MANFALDLRALIEKTKGRADEVARKSVIAVGTSLVMKSPVGDPSLWKEKPPPGYVGGRFRANWQHGLNVAPSGTVSTVDSDGRDTIDSIGARVAQAEASGIHYITNSLPYAQALEYGHSTQAPNGMVGITVVEFENYVQQAVAETK
ncbi:hypothetical protein [Collimonas humicola]|uniref:hypothetical protein n=1 Tax=Collimonas humicola TaxID=2825886 RepID=UPI001B8C02FF|nr:hypothetical protein [Collimonas humicola]